jgi:hypothetical protein
VLEHRLRVEVGDEEGDVVALMYESCGWGDGVEECPRWVECGEKILPCQST